MSSHLRLVQPRHPEPPSRSLWWTLGVLVGFSLALGWLTFAVLVLVAMWGVRSLEG